MKMQCGERQVDLSEPAVMGVLNVTPDSFYDGGQRYRHNGLSLNGLSLDLAVKHAQHMVAQGATFIDVGGESTRPGASAVSLQEEKLRVLPVIEALSSNIDAVISIDTSQPDIMREAGRLGAGLINDVRSLARPGALAAAAATGLPVCLMHMQGEPLTMQHKPDYKNVVSDVNMFFEKKIQACANAGIARDKLILDPGIGFGKNDEHNLTLINELHAFTSLGCPLLFGISRKSMIGRLLKRETKQRLPGSLGFALVAMHNGANIIRVHDVAETVDMVKVFSVTQLHRC